ncbi:MAG TPA: GNAT family N-acetyltransferase [Candidatus Solibacter sp.]|jgi:putative acetyltransferase|nr:GNAT family N-acetyltransferase [Candidatus Solibacter sp.]
MDFEIRAGRDDDAWDLVGLVAGCWSEYPGCVLDVHGEEPELLAIASAYRDQGGRFWVAERDGRLIASIGMVPAPDTDAVLLQKLYVARSARRQGLGQHLVGLVESQAAELGAARVELWTDTRFEPAHRLYERLGYRRNGNTRELHDLSRSVEFHYGKELPNG